MPKFVSLQVINGSVQCTWDRVVINSEPQPCVNEWSSTTWQQIINSQSGTFCLLACKWRELA